MRRIEGTSGGAIARTRENHVLLRAELRIERSGLVVGAYVDSVDAGGCTASCRHVLPRGTALTLTLRGEIVVPGRVTRSGGNRVHILFSATIDLDAIVHGAPVPPERRIERWIPPVVERAWRPGLHARAADGHD